MRISCKCLFCMAVLLSACGGKSGNTDTASAGNDMIVSSQPDSTDSDGTVSLLLPHSDDSFDDFIYYFSSVPRFQKERTRNPLVYEVDDRVKKVNPEKMEHDSLFFGDVYYTRIFNSDEELEENIAKEPENVIFEWIYLVKPEVKEYHFAKEKGKWFLDKVLVRDLVHNTNNDFVTFFRQFATDSAYQVSHVTNPIIFVTSDPEDEFSVVEATISREQWNAFKPTFPKERMSNFIFDNIKDTQTGKKILCLSGVENGFNNILHFRKTSNAWVLFKFEDLSN